VAAVSLIAPAALRAQDDRPSDADVKKLVESVDQARDRFEDQLEGNVKNSVVRSETGEINVKAALEDFQKELERLKSRLSPTYAASAEVASVLRRANVLSALMKSQPASVKGANEWDRLASSLKTLAGAYRADFPTPERAVVRRISDGEAAATAEAIAKAAEGVKKAVSSDKTLAKPDKEALLADADALIKSAKTVQSRLKDGKPATADVRAVREKVAALSPSGKTLPPAILSAIGALRAPLEKLDQAFGAGPSTL